ncbi:putative dinucleotide-binding enzyme [Chryseobacterium sp. H1D6B]|uniref:NADPH-dependent F420 reductase n=1 Tax=Chryseobacterium sp. H1D6B TaxID=2940588 RepID=UPI00181D2396|nr:NAD(P)-binding domain-containing protein [Chryseobacterium sp. H1D6B]MDH6253762.1 putative dinucleotide-binding enzyme [Chryseobacterium sp. H1D6B]
MTTLKTAVIGLGNIGQAVAGNFVKSNRSFIAADRNVEKAKELSEKWGPGAVPSDIPAAVKNADIVILSIPFESICGFMKEYASDLEGKIIVDPSNPIAPDANGGFKKIIEKDESAGEINAASLPKNSKLVKALGTLGAGSLSGSAYQTPEKAVLFYAADDTSIDNDVEQLIQNSGFEPARIGGIDQSIRIEVFGDLHEFGALGKTVTLSEAKQKI